MPVCLRTKISRATIQTTSKQDEFYFNIKLIKAFILLSLWLSMLSTNNFIVLQQYADCLHKSTPERYFNLGSGQLGEPDHPPTLVNN